MSKKEELQRAFWSYMHARQDRYDELLTGDITGLDRTSGEARDLHKRIVDQIDKEQWGKFTGESE